MEQLKIRTGELRLEVTDDNGDVRGIFRFNPSDVSQAKRFLELAKEFPEKQKEFQTKADGASTDEEKVDILVEIVEYFEEKIDSIFGIGTSKTLFGESKTLFMVEDFLAGIIPYYEKERDKRITKYKK